MFSINFYVNLSEGNEKLSVTEFDSKNFLNYYLQFLQKFDFLLFFLYYYYLDEEICLSDCLVKKHEEHEIEEDEKKNFHVVIS